MNNVIGTTASCFAIIAGLLALFDRWRRRAFPANPAPEAAPSLIVLSRPSHALRTRPTPRRSLLPRSGRTATTARFVLILMAWFVCFAAGTNVFVVTVLVLAEVFPAAGRAAQATGLAGMIGPADVLSVVLVTNFLSIFLLTSTGWKRRGAWIALAAGIAIPNLDFVYRLIAG